MNEPTRAQDVDLGELFDNPTEKDGDIDLKKYYDNATGRACNQTIGAFVGYSGRRFLRPIDCDNMSCWDHTDEHRAEMLQTLQRKAKKTQGPIYLTIVEGWKPKIGRRVRDRCRRKGAGMLVVTTFDEIRVVIASKDLGPGRQRRASKPPTFTAVSVEAVISGLGDMPISKALFRRAWKIKKQKPTSMLAGLDKRQAVFDAADEIVDAEVLARFGVILKKGWTPRGKLPMSRKKFAREIRDIYERAIAKVKSNASFSTGSSSSPSTLSKTTHSQDEANMPLTREEGA